MKINTLEEMRGNKDFYSKKVLDELMLERPSIGQHTWKMLKHALAIGKRNDLLGKTLLDKQVRQAHQHRMMLRFEKMVEKNNLKNSEDLEIAQRSRLRFFTLVHSVEALDIGKTMYQIRQMKDLLKTCIKEFPGVRCVGAIEVEIVNVRKMGKTLQPHKNSNALAAPSMRRKLNVIEALMPVYCIDDEAVALIHFHGLLDLGESNPDIVGELLKERLKLEELWSKAGHQIQIKSLTEIRGEKKKPVRKSLEHIARYITKGGNMIYDGNIALRYKLSFDQDDLDAEFEMVTKGHRSSLPENEAIRRESKEDGIENDLAMTYKEILFLAEIIHKAMSINRSKDGYVISI